MAEIDRKTLLDALSLIKPAGKRKAGVEASEYFIFNRNYVYSTDGEIVIAYPFASENKFAVEQKVFLELLKRTTSEKIEVNLVSNALVLKTKRMEAKFTAILDEKFYGLLSRLSIPTNDSEDWLATPSDLTEGMRFCLTSVSNDSEEVVLTCLCFDKGNVVGTDEFRTSVYSLSSPMQSFFLPNRASKEFSKFKDIEAYCISENKRSVLFKTASGVILGSALYAKESVSSYFDYNAPFDFEGKVMRLPKELKKIVGRVAVAAQGEDHVDKKIHVTIFEKKIICESYSDSRSVSEYIDIAREVKNKIEFDINPFFLMESLEMAYGVKIGEDRLVFSNSKLKHVISLFPSEYENEEEDDFDFSMANGDVVEDDIPF